MYTIMIRIDITVLSQWRQRWTDSSSMKDHPR